MKFFKILISFLMLSNQAFGAEKSINDALVDQSPYALIAHVYENPALLSNQVIQSAICAKDPIILRPFLVDHLDNPIVKTFAQEALSENFLNVVSSSPQLLNHVDIKDRLLQLSPEEILKSVMAEENEALKSFISSGVSDRLFIDLCKIADHDFILQPRILNRVKSLNSADREEIGFEIIHGKNGEITYYKTSQPDKYGMMVSEQSAVVYCSAAIPVIAAGAAVLPRVIALGDKLEALIENPQVVGAAVVAAAGSAGALYHKMRVSFRGPDFIDENKALSPIDQQFLRRFRDQNKSIFTIDLRIGQDGFPQVTTQVNHDLPHIENPEAPSGVTQPRYFVETGTLDNLRTAPQFIPLQTYPENTAISQEKLSTLSAAQLDIDLANSHNRNGLKNDVEAYFSVHSPDAFLAGMIYETQMQDFVDHVKREAENNKIIDDFPYISELPIKDQWKEIARHLDDQNFFDRFNKDARMVLDRQCVERFIGILKDADYDLLASILKPHVCCSEVFARFFNIMAERACNVGLLTLFEKRLQDIVKNNSYIMPKTAELAENQSKIIDQLNNAKKLLVQSVKEFNKKGLSESKQRELLNLFTQSHSPDLKDRFIYRANETGDYASLTRAFAKMKLNEIEGFLNNPDNLPNTLLYALGVQSFGTIVGPQLDRNDQRYKDLMNRADAEALRITGFRFQTLEQIARDSGFSQESIVNQYETDLQNTNRNRILNYYVHLTPNQGSDICSMLHLALIANQKAHYDEFNNLDGLLSIASVDSQSKSVFKASFSREAKKDSKKGKATENNSLDPKKPRDPKKIIPFVPSKKKSNSKTSNPIPTEKIPSSKLFETPIGKILKNNVTVKIHGKRKLYTIQNDIKHKYLKKGDRFQLDALHRDHIEVYDSRGKSKCVLNLDGTLNESKTHNARGRTIE